MRACMRACVRVCVYACVRACVHACMHMSVPLTLWCCVEHYLPVSTIPHVLGHTLHTSQMSVYVQWYADKTDECPVTNQNYLISVSVMWTIHLMNSQIMLPVSPSLESVASSFERLPLCCDDLSLSSLTESPPPVYSPMSESASSPQSSQSDVFPSPPYQRQGAPGYQREEGTS